MASLRCEDVMSRNPRVCAPNDTLLDVIRTMKELDVGYMPICGQENRLLGVLTDRDVALAFSRNDRPSDLKVSQYMTRDPITCRPNDDVFDAQQRMEEHQVRRVPVVDEDNRLLGIIATADLARHATTSREIESELPMLIESISQPS